MNPRPILILFSGLLIGASLGACTVQTGDNFQNPPPAPPSTCVELTSLEGCEGGSIGYSCSEKRPDDGDDNLVCSDGMPGVGGAKLYCCAPYAQYYSDCAVDSTIDGCGADSMGFACHGETSPDQADSLLACSPGVSRADGGTNYCCTSNVTTPSCAVANGVAGCTGVGIGYTCGGTDTPAEGDPSLACSVPTVGDAAESYCCIPFAQSEAACITDTTLPGCDAGSFGFSCTGPHKPDDDGAGLSCGSGTPASGNATSYCCKLP